MTTLEEKAQKYAQTLSPIDIDEVSVIVRDFCAGYTEALRWRDVNMELPDINTNVLVKDDRLGISVGLLIGYLGSTRKDISPGWK